MNIQSMCKIAEASIQSSVSPTPLFAIFLAEDDSPQYFYHIDNILNLSAHIIDLKCNKVLLIQKADDLRVPSAIIDLIVIGLSSIDIRLTDYITYKIYKTSSLNDRPSITYRSHYSDKH